MEAQQSNPFHRSSCDATCGASAPSTCSLLDAREEHPHNNPSPQHGHSPAHPPVSHKTLQDCSASGTQSAVTGLIIISVKLTQNAAPKYPSSWKNRMSKAEALMDMCHFQATFQGENLVPRPVKQSTGPDSSREQKDQGTPLCHEFRSTFPALR